MRISLAASGWRCPMSACCARRAKTTLNVAYRFKKVRFCAPDERRYKVLGSVTLTDLAESVPNGHSTAVRGRSHIAVGQRVPKSLVSGWKLAGQVFSEVALLSLKDGTGVVANEAAQQLIGMLDVAEVASAVEGVEAGDVQLGAVADVVEPRRSFEEIGVLTEDRGKAACPLGYSLGVLPASRQRLFQQCTGNFTRPVGHVSHKADAMRTRLDIHGPHQTV